MSIDSPGSSSEDASCRSVASLIRRLEAESPQGERYWRHRHLLDCLEEFLEACLMVSAAERAHVEGMSEFHRDDFVERAAQHQVGLRSAIVNYFHSGYAVLDAIGAYALSDTPRDPWTAWARQQEALDSDQNLQRLARILTFRLREPRHVIAAHRRGWRVPVVVAGAGTGAIARRPETLPAVPTGLLARTQAAMTAASMTAPTRDAQLQLTAEVIARNAEQATPELRKIYGILVRTYGIQTEGVGEITPHLVELIGALVSR